MSTNERDITIGDYLLTRLAQLNVKVSGVDANYFEATRVKAKDLIPVYVWRSR